MRRDQVIASRCVWTGRSLQVQTQSRSMPSVRLPQDACEARNAWLPCDVSGHAGQHRLRRMWPATQHRPHLQHDADLAVTGVEAQPRLQRVRVLRRQNGLIALLIMHTRLCLLCPPGVSRHGGCSGGQARPGDERGAAGAVHGRELMLTPHIVGLQATRYVPLGQALRVSNPTTHVQLSL